MTTIEFKPFEIKQYADIYNRWRVFSRKFIPRRYSRKVIAHAEIFGFARLTERGTIYIGEANHMTGLDLPDQVLWHFVQPAIQRADGYSITRDPIWEYLNFNRKDISPIETVLIRLAAAGYIEFLSTGSVWRIYQKEQT